MPVHAGLSLSGAGDDLCYVSNTVPLFQLPYCLLGFVVHTGPGLDTGPSLKASELDVS